MRRLYSGFRHAEAAIDIGPTEMCCLQRTDLGIEKGGVSYFAQSLSSVCETHSPCACDEAAQVCAENG
jgi:hypothetical protein